MLGEVELLVYEKGLLDDSYGFVESGTRCQGCSKGYWVQSHCSLHTVCMHVCVCAGCILVPKGDLTVLVCYTAVQDIKKQHLEEVNYSIIIFLLLAWCSDEHRKRMRKENLSDPQYNYETVNVLVGLVDLWLSGLLCRLLWAVHTV